jgi:antirestriction protein
MNTTTENTISDEPAVYVGTYRKYNEGSIAGKWISLEGHDKESFYEECRELHADEADPEFMFQDFQNFPREFYGESGLAPEIWDWLELDEDDREMLARYCDAIGCEGLTFEDAQDNFYGTADSVEEFAENMAIDHGSIPKDMPNWIADAIDWEAAWNRSLQYDFVYSTGDDGTLYFFHR